MITLGRNGTCNLYRVNINETSRKEFFTKSPIDFDYQKHPQPLPLVHGIKSDMPFINKIIAKLDEFNFTSFKRAIIELNIEYELHPQPYNIFIFYYLIKNSNEPNQWKMHNESIACESSGHCLMSMQFDNFSKDDVVLISCQIGSANNIYRGPFSVPLAIPLNITPLNKMVIADFAHFREHSTLQLKPATSVNILTDVVELD